MVLSETYKWVHLASVAALNVNLNHRNHIHLLQWAHTVGKRVCVDTWHDTAIQWCDAWSRRIYDWSFTKYATERTTSITNLVVIKQTMIRCWHFFNKHLPKEEGGGQNHFSTKKKKRQFPFWTGVTCVFVLLMILQHLLAKRHVEFKVKTAFFHEVRSDLLRSSKCYQSVWN